MNQTKLQQLHARLDTELRPTDSIDCLVRISDLRDLVACLLSDDAPAAEGPATGDDPMTMVDSSLAGPFVYLDAKGDVEAAVGSLSGFCNDDPRTVGGSVAIVLAELARLRAIISEQGEQLQRGVDVALKLAAEAKPEPAGTEVHQGVCAKP